MNSSHPSQCGIGVVATGTLAATVATVLVREVGVANVGDGTTASGAA